MKPAQIYQELKELAERPASKPKAVFASSRAGSALLWIKIKQFPKRMSCWQIVLPKCPMKRYMSFQPYASYSNKIVNKIVSRFYEARLRRFKFEYSNKKRGPSELSVLVWDYSCAKVYIIYLIGRWLFLSGGCTKLK